MLISEFTDPIRPRNVDEGTIAKQPPKFRVGYINDDDEDSWMNTTAVNASAAAGKFFDMYRKTPAKVQRYTNGIWKTEEGWTVDTRTVNERLENLHEEYRDLKKKIAKKRKVNESPATQRPLSPSEQLQMGIGLSPDQIARAKSAIAGIETGGIKNPYAATGGAGGHYSGKYQFGSAARADAASELGLKYVPSRQEFLNDPEMQEKMQDALMNRNMKYIRSDPAAAERFDKLSPAERMSVLSMAHSGGHVAAKNYLKHGKESHDAFGTSGATYRDRTLAALRAGADTVGDYATAAKNVAGRAATAAGDTAGRVYNRARAGIGDLAGALKKTVMPTTAAPRREKKIAQKAPTSTGAATKMAGGDMPPDLKKLLKSVEASRPTTLPVRPSKKTTVAKTSTKPQQGTTAMKLSEIATDATGFEAARELAKATRRPGAGSAGAKELQKLNPQIKNIHRIRAGDVLKIPGQADYTIQKGDTLSGIAKRFGVGKAGAAPTSPPARDIERDQLARSMKGPTGAEQREIMKKAIAGMTTGALGSEPDDDGRGPTDFDRLYNRAMEPSATAPVEVPGFDDEEQETLRESRSRKGSRGRR